MSVGNTSDDGNVSISIDEKVQVYKKADVLITCRGKPILIGKRDKRGRYRIPLMQTQDNCNRGNKAKNPRSFSKRPTASTTFPQQKKQSNGYT